MATQNNEENLETWHGIPDCINADSRINPTLIRKISLRANSAGTQNIRKNLEAPTPFSSPQAMPVSATEKAERIPDPASSQAFSTSPPALDLQGVTTNPKPMGEIDVSDSSPELIAKDPRRKEHEIVVDPYGQPGSQPLPYSSSRDPQIRSKTRSTPDTRRCPPTSFPSTFYGKTQAAPSSSSELSQGASSVYDFSRTQRRKTSPPISPRSRPVQLPPSPTANTNSGKYVPTGSPAPTQHDKRGRPRFSDKIHYFTTCPHASPPASRPIDILAQPRADPDFYPTRPTQTRFIIPGSCFNCDTQQRHAAEEDVLNSNSELVTGLVHELAFVVEQLELMSPIGIVDSEDRLDDDIDIDSRHMMAFEDTRNAHLENDVQGDKTITLSMAPSDSTTLTSANPISVDQQRRSSKIHLIRRLHTLEARIDEIRSAQDASLRYIWQGYVARWGSDTLNIQQRQSPNLVNGYDVAEKVEQTLDRQETCVKSAHEDNTDSSSGITEDLQIVTVDGGSDSDDGATISTDETSLESHLGGFQNKERALPKRNGGPESAVKTGNDTNKSH